MPMDGVICTFPAVTASPHPAHLWAYAREREMGKRKKKTKKMKMKTKATKQKQEEEDGDERRGVHGRDKEMQHSADEREQEQAALVTALLTSHVSREWAAQGAAGHV